MLLCHAHQSCCRWRFHRSQRLPFQKCQTGEKKQRGAPVATWRRSKFGADQMRPSGVSLLLRMLLVMSVVVFFLVASDPGRFLSRHSVQQLQSLLKSAPGWCVCMCGFDVADSLKFNLGELAAPAQSTIYCLAPEEEDDSDTDFVGQQKRW